MPLSCRLCLQYIDQLSLPVRQAVFGNVGILIAFRVGNTDAEVLAKEFSHEFEAQNFVDLNRYEVLVKLLESGANRVPFCAQTLEPLRHRVGRNEKLIARLRERFATPRLVVEDKLNRWMVRKNSTASLTD